MDESGGCATNQDRSLNSREVCPAGGHWLCIAYAFPPVLRSGTQRTLGFVRHLQRLGWEATVLTVEPHGEYLDSALLERVPRSTEVIRVPWQDRVARLKQWMTWRSGRSVAERSRPAEQLPQQRSPMGGIRPTLSEWLNTPDSRVGWVRPAVRMAAAALSQRRMDLIYSTSPYASAHLIALRLKRDTHLPWVADFRDPWRDQPYRARRGALAEWRDARLETRVLNAADYIVVNTMEARAQLIDRNSRLANKCSVIANGWDEDLASSVSPVRLGQPNETVFVHAGQFYGPRSPEPLFRALAGLRALRPDVADRIRLVFIGPHAVRQTTLGALAKEAGIADRVSVLGPRGHREALSLMVGGDAVLLVGGEVCPTESQVPAKLYEYMALRKPILALVTPTGPSARILQEARADAVVCDPRDLPEIMAAIERMATGVATPPDAWTGVDRFSRSRRAAELATVFTRLTTPAAATHLGDELLAVPAVG